VRMMDEPHDLNSLSSYH